MYLVLMNVRILNYNNHTLISALGIKYPENALNNLCVGEIYTSALSE